MIMQMPVVDAPARTLLLIEPQLGVGLAGSRHYSLRAGEFRPARCTNAKPPIHGLCGFKSRHPLLPNAADLCLMFVAGRTIMSAKTHGSSSSSASTTKFHANDGARVLVDRLGHAESAKEAAPRRVAEELRPSDELRRWSHRLAKPEMFRQRYFANWLGPEAAEQLQELYQPAPGRSD